MADADSDAGAECFVCLRGEGTLLTGICACRTLAIHKACQQKLVRSKGDTLCGVCKKPYRNVTVTSKRRCRPCRAHNRLSTLLAAAPTPLPLRRAALRRPGAAAVSAPMLRYVGRTRAHRWQLRCVACSTGAAARARAARQLAHSD